MIRRMLINAQGHEELRIALVAGSVLESYQVEVGESGLSRGNIYRGVVSGIQPALNAAFIDFGAEKNGFLAIQDVVREAYLREPEGGGRPEIDEVLLKNKPVIVQVTRDPEGSKGAALTTNLSLAGRYLVLTPFDDHRGVSRKVEDEEVRRELKDTAAKLELPEGCGVIVRTNALGQTKTELNRDAAALVKMWKRIQAEAKKGQGAKLLYSDQDLILKALRDLLDASVEEVLVDDDQAFESAQAYLTAFLPRAKVRLERYEERVPLFTKFGLEAQIEGIYKRKVPLPSGGAIVIDGTEALTAIDVNSGKSTRAGSQEETAHDTNLEAAREVARQLRLRDIGGLVVVDFIDMRSHKHQRAVEKAVKEAMKADKARSTVGRISANGLLEINRQRIQQELRIRTHRPCPTCDGTGRIASPEMVGLNLLRRIQARAATGRVAGVRIELHPELADAFQNQRRQELSALEREFEMAVEVIAAPGLHRPDELIEWVEREPPERPAKERAVRPAVQARDLALLSPPLEEGEEEEAAAEAEEGAAEGAHEVGKSGRKRKRRRRKGKGGGNGNGHGEGHAAGAAAGGRGERGGARPLAGEPDVDAAPADAGAGEGAEGGAAAAGEGGKRKRKRRRRKGKGAGAAGGGAAEGAGGEGVAGGHGAAEAAGDEADESDGEDLPGEASDDQPEGTEAGSGEAGGASGGRGRRRRRRRGKRKGGGGGEPGTGSGGGFEPGPERTDGAEPVPHRGDSPEPAGAVPLERDRVSRSPAAEAGSGAEGGAGSGGERPRVAAPPWWLGLQPDAGGRGASGELAARTSESVAAAPERSERDRTSSGGERGGESGDGAGGREPEPDRAPRGGGADGGPEGES